MELQEHYPKGSANRLTSKALLRLGEVRSGDLLGLAARILALPIEKLVSRIRGRARTPKLVTSDEGAVNLQRSVFSRNERH